jgi:hypothetical protein
MTKVFLTIDTEVWPQSPGWPHKRLPAGWDSTRALEAYFFGGRAGGPGIDYLLQVFERYELRSTFFVEPLHSLALGIDAVKTLVGRVIEGGHEVGLHLHPEWLAELEGRGLPPFRGPMLSEYSQSEQEAMISAGITRLREAGVTSIVSFRAGSYAADMSTLRGLANHGIRFDTSLNPCFAESFPSLGDTRESITQPVELAGLWELPVSYFIDRPSVGSRRHMQVAACSLAELKVALEAAHTEGWQSVVIVLHSFEFVRTDPLSHGKRAGVQRLLKGRFEGLCRYLAEHRSRFTTACFKDLDPHRPFRPGTTTPIRSNGTRTALRIAEQALSRVY